MLSAATTNRATIPNATFSMMFPVWLVTTSEDFIMVWLCSVYNLLLSVTQHNMPQRPNRPCMHPGCGALVNGRDSKCTLHMQVQRQRENAQRDKAIASMYGSRWRKARAIYLRSNPLCVQCIAASLIVPANVVDHIEPHKGDEALFWNRANWQSLCAPCHSTKTASEDGGFGNERAKQRNDDQTR